MEERNLITITGRITHVSYLGPWCTWFIFKDVDTMKPKKKKRPAKAIEPGESEQDQANNGTYEVRDLHIMPAYSMFCEYTLLLDKQPDGKCRVVRFVSMERDAEVKWSQVRIKSREHLCAPRQTKAAEEPVCMPVEKAKSFVKCIPAKERIVHRTDPYDKITSPKMKDLVLDYVLNNHFVSDDVVKLCKLYPYNTVRKFSKEQISLVIKWMQKKPWALCFASALIRAKDGDKHPLPDMDWVSLGILTKADPENGTPHFTVDSLSVYHKMVNANKVYGCTATYVSKEESELLAPLVKLGVVTPVYASTLKYSLSNLYANETFIFNTIQTVCKTADRTYYDGEDSIIRAITDSSVLLIKCITPSSVYPALKKVFMHEKFVVRALSPTRLHSDEFEREVGFTGDAARCLQSEKKVVIFNYASHWGVVELANAMKSLVSSGAITSNGDGTCLVFIGDPDDNMVPSIAGCGAIMKDLYYSAMFSVLEILNGGTHMSYMSKGSYQAICQLSAGWGISNGPDLAKEPGLLLVNHAEFKKQWKHTDVVICSSYESCNEMREFLTATPDRKAETLVHVGNTVWDPYARTLCRVTRIVVGRNQSTSIPAKSADCSKQFVAIGTSEGASHMGCCNGPLEYVHIHGVKDMHFVPIFHAYGPPSGATVFLVINRERTVPRDILAAAKCTSTRLVLVGERRDLDYVLQKNSLPKDRTTALCELLKTWKWRI